MPICDFYGHPKLPGDPGYPPGVTLADLGDGKEHPLYVECPSCGNEIPEKNRNICCGCSGWGCDACGHKCKGCGEWIHTDCHGVNLKCQQCENDVNKGHLV